MLGLSLHIPTLLLPVGTWYLLQGWHPAQGLMEICTSTAMAELLAQRAVTRDWGARR